MAAHLEEQVSEEPDVAVELLDLADIPLHEIMTMSNSTPSEVLRRMFDPRERQTISAFGSSL